MGTLKDIIDVVSGLEGELSGAVVGAHRSHSLSKSAMEGVLNFPVIVPDSLSIEDATLVAKALERNFATFTLTVMTMNPYLYTMGGAPTAAKYIKKFHQNIDTRVDSTDLLNAIGGFIGEAYNKFDIDYETLTEVSERICYNVFEGVNHAGFNALNMKYGYTIEDVTESGILNHIANRNYVPIYETPNGGTIKTYNDNSTHASYDTNKYSGDIKSKNEIDTVNITVQGQRGAMNSPIGTSPNPGRNVRQFNHNSVSSDFKKSNELVPTLLHMRIYPVDRTKAELPPIDFVVGVKATLHPVSTEEMITNMARGIKNQSKFFNFIRWTTGETRFFKDFVFCINELKIDAINSSSKSSRWWTVLKRRKALAKIKNKFGSSILPNATIIMTKEEVDILRDQYGYDLEINSLAYKLIDSYFLLAFVIVDPALQRVKMLFDGKNEYEELTFASLARENTVDDKKFKEMVNMLGRRI